MALVCLGAAACERAAAPANTADVPAHLPRVCAVSPALSQMLVDLGLGACIVGRHRFDTAVPQDLPVVGDQVELDYEMLLALQPTDVLLQRGQQAVPPRLTQLAEAHGWRVRSFDIDMTSDIERVLLELPHQLSFADSDAGRAARAAAQHRARELAQSLQAALAPSNAVRKAGSLLLLWSVDPPAAFGPASFIGDVVARLGGDNALASGAYPELTLEDVLHLDPRTIVLFADDDAQVAAEARLGRLGQLDIAAVRAGRLALVQDPQVLIPATTLPRIIGRIEAALRALPSEADDESADQLQGEDAP